MSVEKIDAALLSRMFLAGAQNLNANKELINELNVFPVPDGDTGTNMTMTIMSAVNEIQKLEQIEMKTVCKSISSGSLRGARGNSGVILSQLFRGFTKIVKGSDEIDVPMLADAFEKACETAYKAVIKPKEGTILTVAKGMADVASKLRDGQMTVEEFCRNVIDYGNQVLDKTPEMLPVLKEAGVVDSGGKGLMVVLEGAYDMLTGKVTEISFDEPEETPDAEEAKETEAAAEIPKFGYCMEFAVHAEKVPTPAMIDEFHNYLTASGECVVLIAENKEMKVYLNTNVPGDILTKAITFGALTDIVIHNARSEQHEAKLIQNPEIVAKEQQDEIMKRREPAKEVGFVAVAAGDGFAEIFEGLGADEVISGGQTMNPSTEDVINAIDKVNADNIFIYPNNKNIIMAAKQARELVMEKNIIVIETTTVPQGITAMISYDPEASLIENREAMEEAIGLVKTAELTYAIRDTKIDDVEIHHGDIMAVGDSGILSVEKEVPDAALQAVEKMMFEDAALISIYFGKDYSEENANRIASELQERYPDCDIEVNNGGQPVYYCIISVE